MAALPNTGSLPESDAALVAGLATIADITELAQATNLRRDDESRMRELLEALPAAVYTTDAKGRLTFYNRAAAAMWGCEPELGSAQWCGSWRLYWPDGRPMAHEDCPMAIAIKENRPVLGAEAMAERPDGTRVPFIPYPQPLRDERGALIGAVNMLVDITERKRAENRQKALVDELNHRVKNMLATVQSLAVQTLRGSDEMAAARRAFESRLFALSRTHEHLTRESWESADLAAIVDDIVAPYRGEGERIRLAGGAVRLKPQAALTMAMVLNELVTNAAKYGALSVPEGVLEVSWTVKGKNGAGRLAIKWQESGGPLVREPAHHGFGSRLVERGIGQELNGAARIEFAPAGVHCSIEIPLSAGGA